MVGERYNCAIQQYSESIDISNVGRMHKLYNAKIKITKRQRGCFWGFYSYNNKLFKKSEMPLNVLKPVAITHLCRGENVGKMYISFCLFFFQVTLLPSFPLIRICISRINEAKSSKKVPASDFDLLFYALNRLRIVTAGPTWRTWASRRRSPPSPASCPANTRQIFIS